MLRNQPKLKPDSENYRSKNVITDLELRGLLELVLNLGFVIPHFCYNDNLSVSGNCRVCLVEVERAPKTLVSCALVADTIVKENKVFFISPAVKKARENVLEFLLTNHPLDCPVCDQGGECDLQDQALFFGVENRKFYKYKTPTFLKNFGPVVQPALTKCIHCSRCIRFGLEISGDGELGMLGRGNNSDVGTYVEAPMLSEYSGNVVELCPVGSVLDCS